MRAAFAEAKDALDRKALEKLLFEIQMLGCLRGMFSVRTELQLRGAGSREQGVIQLASDTTFAEAIDYFKKKVPTATLHWDDLEKEMHSRAFAVAGLTEEGLLTNIQDTLAKAMRDGMKIEDFVDQYKDTIKRAWHAETVFYTNIADAFGAGRWIEFHQPEVDAIIAAYRYIAHPGARPLHAAMGGRIYAKDDPCWQTWWPPNDYNCHCDVLALYKADNPRLTAARPPEHPRPYFAKNSGMLFLQGAGS